MIFIGYPGIGKSTLVLNQLKDFDIFAGRKFIDLESSFFHFGDEPEHWENTYCAVAGDLHSQGFLVFTSCHKNVRDQFHYLVSEGAILHDRIALVYPSINLYDDWVKMLEDRYNDSGLDKDRRALENAQNNYENQISDLMDDSFHSIIIDKLPTSDGYNLGDIIKRHIVKSSDYIIRTD